MAAFPTITPFSPAVSISTASSSLSYQQLINTLTNVAYKINKIYIQAESYGQASESYTLMQQDSGGELTANPYKPYISPDQYQPIVILDVSKDDFLVNELTTMSFSLRPHESLEMYFFSDSASFAYLLEKADTDISTEEYAVRNDSVNNRYSLSAGVIITSAVLAFASLFYLLKNNRP